MLWPNEEEVIQSHTVLQVSDRDIHTCTMYTTCRYRRTKMGGLADLASVVNSSATVNVAQAVGSMDGTVIVPTYDWTSFLAEHIGKCVGIKSLHHLRFPGNNKGHVFVRHKSDSLEVDMKLLKDDWSPDPTDLPERVMPSGLSLTRQWYLFNKIREYCPDECKDTTCPEPTEPDVTPAAATTVLSSPAATAATSTTTVVVPATASTTGELSETRAKRPRLCGICREEGHNARKCPKKV